MWWLKMPAQLLLWCDADALPVLAIVPSPPPTEVRNTLAAATTILLALPPLHASSVTVSSTCHGGRGGGAGYRVQVLSSGYAGLLGWVQSSGLRATHVLGGGRGEGGEASWEWRTQLIHIFCINHCFSSFFALIICFSSFLH